MRLLGLRKGVSHCRGKGQVTNLYYVNLLIVWIQWRKLLQVILLCENKSLIDIFERRDNGIHSDFYEHPSQVSETDGEMNLNN